MKTTFTILMVSIFIQIGFSQSMVVNKNDGSKATFPLSDIKNITFEVSGIPTNGLVAYYPFNGNANDESGNNLNLTKNGNPTLTIDRKGISNKAYSFNGTTDYFKRETSSLLLPTSEFTLCAWINNAGIDGVQDVIISTLENNVGAGYQLHLDNTATTVGGFIRNPDGSYVDVVTPYSSSFYNSWLFITFTYSNTNGTKIYINGSLKKETKTPFQIKYETVHDLYIGTNNWYDLGQDRMFKGKIDDVRFYNRALTALEVQALFNE